MDALFRHLASCCSPQQPRTQADGSTADELASCMEQLRVADSPARDCSCRSGAISSPRLRSSPAKAADAAATDLPQYRLFTFDIETTGLSPYKDAIIEMAVVDVATGSNWSSLVRPEPYKKSSRDAFNAHGISHYDLLKPGVPTQAAALQALSQFIRTHTSQHAGAVPLLVAHNGYAFDFRALAVAVHRQQQQALQQQQRQQTGLLAFWKSSNSSSSGVQMPEHLMVLDTLVIARRLGLKRAAGLSNLQQATVREHFLGAPPSVVHRALADAQELAALLPHLLSWAAAQAGSGLDEKLLPRTFASFVTAATTAAAAAAATGPESAAGDEARSSTAGAASAAAGASSSSMASSSSSSGGTKAAAGRPVAAAAKRGRGKKAVAAAAAAGPAPLAAAADVGSDGSFAVSDSLRSEAKQRVVSSTDRARDDLIASVTAAAAIALDISSDEDLLDLSQAGVSSMAVVAAAAAVQGFTQVQQDLSNSTISSSTVAVEQAHSSSKIWSCGGHCTSSSSKAESSRVSAVTVLDRAGQQQQQQDSSSSEWSTATAAAHVSHDCAAAAAAAAAAALLSVTATAGGTSAQLGPTQSSSATNSSAGSGLATGNTQQLSQSSGIHSCLPAALEDGITSSSSRAAAGAAAKARPRPRPRAAAAAAAAPAVVVPMFVNIKARSVPIVQSSEFLQVVQASFSNSGSSSSNDCPRLQLGPFIPGRSDPSSGFSKVLLGLEGLPVAFLLEGLVISKNIKLTRIDGRIQAGSLFVKPASRHKALQQHIKQVGAAINSLSRLPQQPPPQQQQQQPSQQQQQQGCGQLAEQDLYTCMIGNSLQVKLPVKQGAPYLDTVARQLSDSSRSSSGDTTSNSAGQSSSRRLLPVATPHLAVSDVAERLQQLLPVGAAVSLVLWPSMVWRNSKFRGVTLNCVEVWLQ